MYRNINDTLPIFILTEEDVNRSSTLEKEDIGTWCFMMRGCIMGFYKTESEAHERVDQIMCD